MSDGELYDSFALYKALEFNFKLFLAFYPGSDKKSIETPNNEQIHSNLTALENFYNSNAQLLSGCEPSKLGNILPIINTIIGLAAIIVGCVVAPPVAAGGALILLGLWGLCRSQGTALRKEQTELITEVNHSVRMN